jgi:hypothetical protein
MGGPSSQHPSGQQTMSGPFLCGVWTVSPAVSLIGQQGVEPCNVLTAGHPEPAAAQDILSAAWCPLRLRSNHDIGWARVVACSSSAA